MVLNPDGSIRTTVAGRTFSLDRALVEARVEGVLPEPLTDHYAAIGGRRYPPKQVISLVTGLDRADFTTHQARRILRRLGFTVGRKADAVLGSAEPSRIGPHGGAEAEALAPYVGKWVAQKGLDVLVAADTPLEVVQWLHRHDMAADGVFRVPASPAEVEGAGPS